MQAPAIMNSLKIAAAQFENKSGDKSYNLSVQPQSMG